ncbi:MAG: amidohydrolase [Acidimicrobiia bacterium]
MAPTIDRIVDAHVHLWDPARTDWYPYLSGNQQLNMGDISGMCRYFDQKTYFAESANWNVVKIVHVAAAASAHTIDETMELDEQYRSLGQPAAIVGGVNPMLSDADVEKLLDSQMASPRFCGVRQMGGSDGAVPRVAVLKALQDRKLVLDLMAHTADLHDAAAKLAAWPELSVVVEHSGWPHTNTPEEFADWKAGMSTLAAVGDNVVCKISGLAMPLGSTTVDAFRPWVEHCLETFGAGRCMFASNFPVDGMHGTFDELFSTYATIASGLSADDREKAFATTAERVYHC